ncbi:MAG: NADH-quinone oxidoreductase subunit L, partial [Actinobacteria bacterium]
VTWITFMMGWLAILGVPPFSGFWSKDKIIEAAFSVDTFAGSPAPWAGWLFGLVALVGAGVTAFYMSRLFFMTFHGTARWTTEEEGAPVHPHESGLLMTIPMVILAIGAIFIGGVLSIGDFFSTWLTPSIGPTIHGDPVMPIPVIMGATLLLVVIGAAVAWKHYGQQEVPTAVPAANGFVHAARNDLYQDTINDAIFVIPGSALVTVASTGDSAAIDGIVRGVAGATKGAGKFVSITQTGNARTYAFYTLGGVVLALVIILGFQL